ncbi:hypothetical protein GCM10009743_65420 [Kribbella swartbergensis]
MSSDPLPHFFHNDEKAEAERDDEATADNDHPHTAPGAGNQAHASPHGRYDHHSRQRHGTTRPSPIIPQKKIVGHFPSIPPNRPTSISTRVAVRRGYVYAAAALSASDTGSTCNRRAVS